jgi:hypothetical protein
VNCICRLAALHAEMIAVARARSPAEIEEINARLRSEECQLRAQALTPKVRDRPDGEKVKLKEVALALGLPRDIAFGSFLSTLGVTINDLSVEGDYA